MGSMPMMSKESMMRECAKRISKATLKGEVPHNPYNPGSRYGGGHGRHGRPHGPAARRRFRQEQASAYDRQDDILARVNRILAGRENRSKKAWATRKKKYGKSGRKRGFFKG